MSDISFNYLKSLFDEQNWDIGVLTPENFHRTNLHPVKIKLHNIFVEDYSNHIHFRYETNALVVIRHGHTWDYTHYDEALDILESNGVLEKHPNCMVYTNFKEAAILSGLGVRAKNSLIYSYKFGFDCHIAVIRFSDNIVDLPENKRINYKIWNRCIGCDDCAKACPVGAIHNSDKNPFAWWIDSPKCDNFIGLNNHPRIPSIKEFWHKNVYPEIDKQKIESITTTEIAGLPFEQGGLNDMPWDKNGYSYDGQVVRNNGEPVNIPVCRECISQPRCSKWNGNYPYDDIPDHGNGVNIVDMAKHK